MAETQFLDLVESIRAEDATVQRVFADDGVSVRSLFGQMDEAKRAEHNRKVTETMRFVRAYQEGRIAPVRFREAMTTSDFPYLFGDVIDRTLLGAYQMFPSSWEMWCKKATVRDFRSVKRKYLNGGDGTLAAVKEADEYPIGTKSDGEYTYAVEKYGRKIPFSWESMINDDLQAFTDTPIGLGRAAKRTIERFATTLICDTNGPDATFFSAAHANLVTNKLNVAGLNAGASAMYALTDAGGEPILNEPAILAVPPALKLTAMQLVNALQIQAKTSGGGSSAEEIYTTNLFSNLQIAVLSYMPKIITATPANASTSWFLFASPEQVERPAVEIGLLKGHEEPEVFMKSPNAVRVGGGDASAMDGDFETDGVVYKTRFVFGGATMDYRAAVGSNGTGS